MPKFGKGLVWAIGVSLALTWACHMSWKTFPNGVNDFLAFYAGARDAGTPELYDAPSNERAQREYLGAYFPVLRYIRPPFYAVLLKPFSWLPFLTAYWLWQALTLAALGWFLWTFRRDAAELPWVGLMSVPMLCHLLNGQDTTFWLAAAGCAIVLMRAGRDYAAGLVLALCAAKFHLFVFVPVALLAARRWKVLAAGAAGVAVAYILSVPGQGWAWPVEYARVLMTAPVHPEPYNPPNIRGLAKALELPEVGLTVVAAAVALWAVCRKGVPIEERVGMALAGGLLLSRHAFIQDCVLLYATLAFVPATRWLVLVLLCPIPFFLMMADGPVSAVMPALLATVPLVYLTKDAGIQAYFGLSVSQERRARSTP